MRTAIRDRYQVATTFGFGPRFLHSTGQLHKGGPQVGCFIQVVDPDPGDLPIPGKPFGFGTLIQAQAIGDLPGAAQPRPPGRADDAGRARVALRGSPVGVAQVISDPKANPLRVGLRAGGATVPAVFVIFGATGDLAHRKLLPAIYNLGARGLLPNRFAVVGYARREMSDDEDFASEARASLERFSRTPIDESYWTAFADSLHYQSGGFDDPERVPRARRAARADRRRATAPRATASTTSRRRRASSR